MTGWYDRAASALRAHAPGLAGTPLEPLGHGLDNAAFLAGGLVLRVSLDGDVGREARLLHLVARHTSLPVPAPSFVDTERGVLAYPLLPGRPLLNRVAPAGIAYPLGVFLRELHGIDVALVDGCAPVSTAEPAGWLAALPDPPDLLRSALPATATRLVLAHADLGAEHLLESSGALTGVIDWTDAAVTDPALDFARIYRDFGPRFLDDVLGGYGRELDAGTWERMVFFARCTALEDLVYGGAHADAARRSLDWLMP